MHVKIYQRRKNAMQSGKKNLNLWYMRFESGQKEDLDPLMGWVQSHDTNTQVKLSFKTKEDAILYAQEKNYSFEVQNNKKPHIQPKTYAENFSTNRRMPWTH